MGINCCCQDRRSLAPVNSWPHIMLAGNSRTSGSVRIKLRSLITYPEQGSIHDWAAIGKDYFPTEDQCRRTIRCFARV